VRVHWADETFVLLPDRAVWWERTATLLIADLHLGKPAAFRSAGVPVPDGTTGADLARAAALVAATGAHRLIVLGDFLHARAGRSPPVMAALSAWRNALPALRIVLVRGNHDARAGDPPADLRITCVDEPLVEPGPAPGRSLHLRHHPPGGDRAAGEAPAICGHLHPAVVLDGPAGASLRSACYWFTPTTAVLPAFGRFTGTFRVRPRRGDRVFVVGPGEVLEAATPPPRSPPAPPPRRARAG
jgi:DNA ligase-associated metallophosphoesterase